MKKAFPIKQFRHLMQVLHNFLHHAVYIPNKYVTIFFNFIQGIRPAQFAFALAVYYIIGIYANHIYSFPYFYLYQFIFLFIATVSFWSVRYFHKTMNRLHLLMVADDGCEVNIMFERIRTSTINFLIPPIGGAFFGIQALLLVDIPIWNVSAVYMMLSYVICVLISFMGYLQYVYLKIYVYKLYKGDQLCSYEKEYPAKTEWVRLLAKLASIYRNVLFLLGMTYVLAVYGFITLSKFGVLNKAQTNASYTFLLVCFIICGFVAIVIFFPVSAVIEYSYIKKIIERQKDEYIAELRQQNDSLSVQIAQLIISVRDTPDYPFKDAWGRIFSAITVFVNLGASVATIVQWLSV